MSDVISGPWFEDFSVGDEFADAPTVTITEGYTAIHQAMFGDRMRLPLDNALCYDVMNQKATVVNPSLVANIVIGQSTYASQRVMGNLFYRGLVFKLPVSIGDTLNTTTRVVALRQNRIKEGRANSGMVALEICARNQFQEEVMFFWRCPMIPCKNPQADTGHQDSFDQIPEHLDMDSLLVTQLDWDTDIIADIPGLHFQDLNPGTRFEVEARDTITAAPELVRLTLNMAMTHTDARRSVYGKRLVYGGHTISMAAAQLSRALPNLVTIVAWHSCDHLAPVFEEDILRSEITVGEKYPLNDGGLVDLRVEVLAERFDARSDQQGTDEVKVLDWHLVGRFA
jgi:2-methylfumaryl-CoA hydratase